MARFTYFLFNIAVFIPVFALSFHKDITIYKKWKSLAWTLFLVSVPFIIWDVWAAQNSHWFFSSRYTLSFRFFGLPLEEIFFFVSVPFAMLFVWEVLNYYSKSKKLKMFEKIIPKHKNSMVVVLIGLLGILLATFYWQKGYTRSTAIASVFTSIILYKSRLITHKNFALFQFVHMLLFIACNAFLTALPIILYNSSSIIGTRIGSIPIEDFLFSYSLISMSLVVYTRLFVSGREY